MPDFFFNDVHLNMDLYGLVGRNISYSFSRNHFAAKFAEENIDAEYVNFDIGDISQIRHLILANPNLRGLNVTIPYKEDVRIFLDELSEDAAAIGAVNTIEFLENYLIGHNTDWIGFRDSISPLLEPHHTKALILGTGGASKAVAYALEQLKIDFSFVSRGGELNYSDLGARQFEDHTVIINCTPLGTFPNVDEFPLIPYYHLTEHHLAFDLVYNPQKTLFLSKADEVGAKIKNGRQMLEIQAEEAWKIWNRKA